MKILTPPPAKKIYQSWCAIKKWTSLTYSYGNRDQKHFWWMKLLYYAILQIYPCHYVIQAFYCWFQKRTKTAKLGSDILSPVMWSKPGNQELGFLLCGLTSLNNTPVFGHSVEVLSTTDWLIQVCLLISEMRSNTSLASMLCPNAEVLLRLVSHKWGTPTLGFLILI